MAERADGLDLAVNALLRSRLELLDRLGRVDAALDALGVDAEARDADDAEPERALQERDLATHTGRLHGSVKRRTTVSHDHEPDFLIHNADGTVQVVEVKTGSRSVRAAVQEVLDLNDVWFTTTELSRLIRDALNDGRELDKVKSNVRSSLWSLRQKGSVVATENHTYKSAKWTTDTDAAPGKSEAASGSIPAEKEGGSTNGIDADRVRDHHSLGTADDRAHGIGAPVVGVPS